MPGSIGFPLLLKLASTLVSFYFILSTMAQTGFHNLPLEILQSIMEYAVIFCGLYKSPRLRLVDSTYDSLQQSML